MNSRGLLGRLDDGLNPIVVKELRQAVRSRLVTSVLLLFLGVQLTYLAARLVVTETEDHRDPIRFQMHGEFEGGREAFAVIQGILLGTCMLFLPMYTGVRLAAERSEVNVDLLFITTLRPRAIVTGKLTAALVLALMIFSACAPFMVFTYFLRGIDLPTIFFVVAIDFVAVMVTVQLGIFLAVVPANRVLKGLLGLLGLFVLSILLTYTLAGTLYLLYTGLPALLEDPEFPSVLVGVSLMLVAFFGLLFVCSVALLNPPSANRALPVRIFLLLFGVASGGLFILWDHDSYGDMLFIAWIVGMGILCSLSLIIAVSEREQWGPRMERAIPRRWWLRWPTFLFYSGAAGGVLFSLLLLALTAVLVQVRRNLVSVEHLFMDFRGEFVVRDARQVIVEMMGAMFLYIYCYALTASWIRRVFLPWLPSGYTWIAVFVLLAVGCAVPFLTSFLLLNRGAPYATHVPWLLPNPGVAIYEFREPHSLSGPGRSRWRACRGSPGRSAGSGRSRAARRAACRSRRR